MRRPASRSSPDAPAVASRARGAEGSGPLAGTCPEALPPVSAAGGVPGLPLCQPGRRGRDAGRERSRSLSVRPTRMSTPASGRGPVRARRRGREEARCPAGSVRTRASSVAGTTMTATNPRPETHRRLPGRRGRLRVCADPVEAGQDRGAHLRRIPAPGRGPGRGGLAQCEPSATRSTPPRTVRAQRDGIRPGSILASPPRTMRAEVTSPIRLPPGAGLGRRRRRRRGRRRPTPPGGAGARRRCPPYPWRIDRLPREWERAGRRAPP